MQSVTHDSGLNDALQQSETYTAALALAATAQQFSTEAGEALIMIFVGMVAPDGINVLSSQALLRQLTVPVASPCLDTQTQSSVPQMSCVVQCSLSIPNVH